MLGRASPVLGIFVLVLSKVSANFINFEPGYEYQYKYDSSADVKNIGLFNVLARIGYTNVNQDERGQEIHVRVYAFQLKTKHSDGVINHGWDLSKWFSFLITPQGEITEVYHPARDDEEAVAIKKGAAAMFASRLHHADEGVSRATDGGWTYSVSESGHEGRHTSTYTVQPSSSGHLFTKVRHPGHHPVKHADSEYTKTLFYDRELGNIHTVEVEEKFKTMHRTADGYDPYENLRPVKPVNNFTNMETPEMSAMGSGRLEFISKNKVSKQLSKPKDTTTSSIHIEKVRRRRPPIDVQEYMGYIQGNLTCMRNEPDTGSKTLDKCFHLLLQTLLQLPDAVLKKVAHDYLGEKPRLTRTYTDQNHMLDAIGAMTTPESQQLLLELVLERPKPDPTLVKRYMLHIATLEHPPIDGVIKRLEKISFDRDSAPFELQNWDTYHRVVLIMGVVARRLWDANRRDEAVNIVLKLENNIGMHDPWLYRNKRSVLNEEEVLADDRQHVIFLGSLGNAGLDQSYEMIVSHVNSSNSAWVKRAGIHAMRKYSHQMAAEEMLKTALFDEDDKVRYEAMLQYQAHPMAGVVASHYRQGASAAVNGSVFYDPHVIGVQDVHVHHRSRRDILDKIRDLNLQFDLASPTIDWRKMLGSTKIGASFGLIISNALNFKISPLEGYMKVNVHDEAYARIHLGFMGMNLEFFLARICFKGGAEYNLNLLQEYGIDNIQKLVKLYDTIKGKAVGAVQDAIELFRSIINGEFSLNDMIEDFKNALEELPEKVINVGKKASDAMELLGGIDESQLPPFINPAKNLVVKVSNFYKELKTSILAFYNKLMETVTIIIPRAGKMIFKAIQAIIKGFKTFHKDPKQAIATVASNVVTIGIEVKNLVSAVNKTKQAFTQEPPDWMDLTRKVGEIVSLGLDARRKLKAGGEKWVADVTSGQVDPVDEFSKGRTNMTAMKQQVIQTLNDTVNDVLSPLDALTNIGGKFGSATTKVFSLIADLKEAYNALKEGYRTARSLIDRVFGPKFHKDFPRTIRQPGGGCDGSGSYPSELKKGDEYEHDGVDVTISSRNEVVAPFGGKLQVTGDYEVIILASDGSLKNTEIILTNIQPNDTIQNDMVSAGQVIGTAANSPCGGNQHVHVALRKDGGYVDPTKYLEARIPEIPAWKQECDDYKLVFKMETIAEDCIVCLDGKKENDTSPERTGGEIENPPDVPAAKDPTPAVEAENKKPDSFYSRMKQNRPAIEEKASKTGDGALKTLFKKAGDFFEKFSIRNLKMGTIMDLLEILGLEESQAKMADVILTVKQMIDQKPCMNPYQMTDDELRAELIERGVDSSGSRETMIKTLTTPTNQCPILKLSLPKNIYCTFDDKCLGLECCVHFKVFVFRKTYKLYARYDPCDSKFVVGADTFNKSLDLDNIDKKLPTGVKMDIMGGVELFVKVKLERDETAALLTVAAGFCTQDDTDNCLPFFSILDEAITPIPICNPDGSVTWPKVDWKALLDKESIKERIRESAEQFAKDLVKEGIEELISQIPCIPKQMPGKTKPCPRPGQMTLEMLQNDLQERGLETTGSKTELAQRLTHAHQTCKLHDKTVTLPSINSESINKVLYLQISQNCLRLDACLDIKVKAVDYWKTVSAYIDIDPCKFMLTFNFEDCTRKVVLFASQWGKQQELDFGGVVIRFKIDRDLDKKIFVIDMGLAVNAGGSETFDTALINDLEIPIPVCNENFTLSGVSSWKELANEMGGNLVREMVDVMFSKLGLDKIFTKGICEDPPEKPDCPWTLPDYKKLLPKSFEDNVHCQLSDNCFGIQCCANFSLQFPIIKEPVQLSLPFFIKFEPCEFKVKVGFGKYYHEEVLLTYNWGSERQLSIGSGDPAPIEITFKISKYSQGFMLDLKIDTCIPVDEERFCFPSGGLTLLKDEKVPACDANALVEYTKQNFSMSEWLSGLDLDINLKTLSQAAATMLLDKFGISQYLLDNRCDITRAPYTPDVEGWSNECKQPILRLPNLPKGLHCHLAESCTEITCCFYVEFLNMSVNAVFNLDMCDYTLYAAIEKKSYSLNLLGDNVNPDVGTTQTLNIAKVFEAKFGVKKRDKRLILDLDLKVCFQDNACLLDLSVMKGTEIPQLGCDLNANLRNFSLADWAKAKGQDVLQGLTRGAVRLLLEQLGLDDKILAPPCDRTSLKYQPADTGHWKSDCDLTRSAISLPSITLPANCYINDKCLGIDCCLYSDLLDLALHTTFNIDLCNYVIEGSIEKFTFKHYLVQYEWGKDEEITIDGVPVIRINFKIDRLLSQQVFVVDMTANLCLEGDMCGLKLTIMDNTKLPMPGCAKLQGFKIPDFSLSDWLRDKGEEITAQLSERLMSELGITPFLLDNQCQTYRQPYIGALNGWKNDCPDITPPNLPSNIKCHVADSCTAVTCCVEVEQVKRNFHAFIDLDACNFHFRVGIEKLEYSASLIDYNWGQKEEVDLGGLFRIEYTINSDDKRFLIDLDLKVCLSASSDTCAFTLSVFKDMIVPKPICDWEATKNLKDFSLTEFLAAQGEAMADRLKADLVDKLLESLGVLPYLHDPQCSLADRTATGWDSECPRSLTLPTLPTGLACSIPDHCTGVDCCLDLPLISRNVQFKVDLDMCKLTLTLAVEKVEFKTLLFKYKWGQPDSFHLRGIFRVDFIIDKLEAEKEVVVSVNISACFEADKKCYVTLPVLKQARFPIPVCDWNATLSLRDFSLSSWLNDNVQVGAALTDALRFQLTKALGISTYLLDPMCDQQSGIYTPDASGWNNACPKATSLPALPESVSCHIPDYCTGLDCCVGVDSLGMAFNFRILLDTQNMLLTIGIEKLEFKTTLFNYQWGKWEFFNLNGVVRIGFKIEDLHHAWKYLLSVKLSLCFESNKPCLLDMPVLTDVAFPKLIWNWDHPFAAIRDGFSLSKWLSEMSLTSASDLTGFVLTKLMDEMGITNFLNEPQCSPSLPPYAGAFSGWKKDCPAPMVLPSLPTGVVCHLSDPCGTVECCVTADIIKRSINVKIGIDPCKYTFTMGIEKLVFTRALSNYKWGQVEHFNLKDFVRIEFMIDNLYGERKFLVDLNISLCLEKDSCLLSFPVLQGATIPKPLCDWDSTAALADFSLADFLAEVGGTGLSTLTSGMRDRLFERLEIAGYLQSEQCLASSTSSNRWKNDCPVQAISSLLPSLPNSMACHLGDMCTAIDCCIDVNFLSRAFQVLVNVDMCKYQLVVGVEKLVYRHMLFDYEWGEENHFYLKGVVRIDYKISLIEEERELEVSVRASVCLKQSECLVNQQLLDKARLPQPLCDWDAILHASDFSLAEWAMEKGLSSAVNSLSDSLISQLLDDIGASQYLQQPQCSHGDSLYSPSDVNNWKKECSSMTVPSLPDNVRCHVTSNCAVFDCCVDVPLVKRSIHIKMDIDICNLELTFTIERLTYKLSLLQYKWGTQGQFLIGSMARLVYNIQHIPANQKLVIDANIKVCFDATCSLDVPVFSQSELVYSPCDPSLPVPFDGVSVDFWKLEKCELPTSACSTSLPAPVSDYCQLIDTCMGVSCCASVDMSSLGTYDVNAGISVDHCTDTLDYFIENKSWSKKLSVIEYDKSHTETIGGAITVTYRVSKQPTAYTVTFHAKLCAFGKCREKTLLDEKNFSVPSCTSGSRRRRSAPDIDFKKALSDLVLKGVVNDEVDQLINQVKEDSKTTLQNMKFDDLGTATNPRTAIKGMGDANPSTILYSGKVGHGNVVFGMEGGEKIMKILGQVTDVVGRGDQAYTVGKGLTGKGLQLLGAKLANMTIGEMIALFDVKNIDPVLALKLTRQIRDLALALYSDVIDAVLNGKAADTFGSFDLTLQGDFSFPRQSITFFKYSYFFMIGGIVPMTFSFGAGATYGMKLIVGAKILGLTVFGEAIPYGGAHVWGELGIGFILYGKLRFDGYVMNIAFPSRAEIGFFKFPLALRLTMDLELIPLEMVLRGLVTLEINLLFKTFKKTLYSAKIYSYAMPIIRKRIIDVGTKEEDESPPQFVDYVAHDGRRRKRQISGTRNCLVRQLPGRDRTEPAVEIGVSVQDDRSQVQLYLDVGTRPGLSDVLSKENIGGSSVVITEHFKTYGVPMYFTVYGENSASARSTVTCSIPTYDITDPGGRLQAEYMSTSNPAEIRGNVVVYEDSDLIKSAVGVGLGKGVYADEVIAFNKVDLKLRDNGHYDLASDNFGHVALEHFTGMKAGRLIGPKFAEFFRMNHAGSCVKECMKYPERKCMSVNYDYGTSGHCELLEAIEGHDYKISQSGQYAHYERIGVGLAYEFVYEDLSLVHDKLYYFNLHLVNDLEYESILHSEGVHIDVTPPEPGPLANVSSDRLTSEPCHSVVPDDRPDWEDRCRGMNLRIKNHRTIIDGPGSMSVFNGDEPLTDLRYTRANRYVSANWDGIHDKETRILGYSWTVGRQVCEELIHPHHDPHKHLFDESEWTHTGLISPLPEPYDPLPDGKYYVTLRALNKVDYGGPLVTTICHTTPYVVDNSPPLMHEIYNITYDEETYVITAMYNASDPDSDIREMDLCLGGTTRDCQHLEWTRSGHTDGSLERKFEIPGGTPVWIKLRAVNHVDLMRVGVADHPIIIDTSPPEAGMVYDGPVFKQDLNFTKDETEICANWFGFYDPESGISRYEVTVLDDNGTAISEPVEVDHKTHEVCVTMRDDRLLQHGSTYRFTVMAYNAGHKQLNVTAESDGVVVDLTPPVPGQVVDGRLADFEDLAYSTHVATVSSQWEGYTDPESDIREYAVQILRAKDLSSEFEVIKDWKTLSRDVGEVEWHNFHLNHRDIVKTTLKTINNALGATETTTNGFVVDLTPPTLVHLGDGLEQGKDIQFQQSTSTVEANFEFTDAESDVDHFQYQVYELYHGQKHQIYPAGGWDVVHDGTSTTLTQTGLTLRQGAMYSVRVGAVNRAGAIATYDTNGVLLDNSKPKMSWVYVGILSGSDEHVVDDYVVQSDSKGIKATWYGKDPQSGIKSYQVAVGTTLGGTDTLTWTDVGSIQDKYISDLTLSVTDPATVTPVYYVFVRSVNGAGMTSDVKTSRPIRVVEQDKAGVVIDGADGTEGDQFVQTGEDMDYQREAGVVTVQFSGFESAEHGVVHYDWAVGTSPGGEEVQPFIAAGLVHEEEEKNVPGNGISTMGFGSAVLPLIQGDKYYTTVRGITNSGNILQATSDGFTVDQTPPATNIESFSQENNATRLTPGSKLYQTEVDSMSLSWKVADNESPVKKMFFSVGTYPHGEDVQGKTEVNVLETGEGALPTGIKPVTDGRPNIVTLTSVNQVGLSSSVISPSLIVDITPPTEGVVTCPSFIQPHSAVECTWMGFFDAESQIEMFELAVGSHEGLEDVVSPIALAGHVTKYLIQGLGDKVTHGQKYFAKVKAINSVGKTSSAISNAINVDTTPPTPGVVVELSSVYVINVTDDIMTEKLNRYKCDSQEDCLSIDAVCQEAMTAVNIAWQSFTDEETDIVKYEVAVGTTPGGGQLRGFSLVDDSTKRYMAVTGLVLKGERQIFVTIKGTNGAGLSSISTSNGVYLSYLSQGLEPISHVGVWDGASDADRNYQTSLTQMDARWDVSGDPCPVVKYEWAIQRVDGLRVQQYINMQGRVEGTNDQLTMVNKERYYQYLRVTNALNYTYEIRSDGITIEEDPLVPGQVNDGDVIGFDLEFLRTRNKISANWDRFGSDGLEQQGIVAEDILADEQRSANQKVIYYEVAVGTDRRFPKTRDNVVPFTLVALNKTVTFYDLDLDPYTAIYYFTVRAVSASGSKTDVTSNGFSVGFDGGVIAGEISLTDYVSTDTWLDVPWTGFESRIGMMMYYAGLSNTTDAEDYLCSQFTERGSVSDEERQSVFNIVDISNVGKDTFIKFQNLSLEQNGVYYAWVIGADKAGKCNMTSYRFTVDVTPPEGGQIRAGPYYDLKLSYSMSSESLEVEWRDFHDNESGLLCFHVSLYKKSSCADDATDEIITDAIEIDSAYTAYTFMELSMQGDAPYFVQIVAENQAGLKTTMNSPPVLFDNSSPSPGLVVDGHDFINDVSWIGTTETVKGVFLHHPIPDVSPCPSRQINFDDSEWKYMESHRNYDNTNRSLTLTYRSANVHPEPLKVDIKLGRDSKKTGMFSGTYYRDADFVNGGEYKISIKAARGNDGPAVTSVMFWDGPEDYILDHDYTPKPDWSESNCACCLEFPVNIATCKCNCNRYQATKDYYHNINKRFAPPPPPLFTVRQLEPKELTTLKLKITPTGGGQVQNPPSSGTMEGLEVGQEDLESVGAPDLTARKSCGMQIITDMDVKSKLVAWCGYGDRLNEPVETVRELEVDPASDYHNYVIRFTTPRDESREVGVSWCMTVLMDGEEVSEECGIPRLSPNTKLFLSVWNHKNYIPELRMDTDGHITVWSATASFVDLVMPPEKEKLCRYGDPFQGGTNAIVRYEAAIGSAAGLSDVVDFQPVHTPCVPCIDHCDKYTCDPSCDRAATQQVNITLNDLDLKETTIVDGEVQPVVHYLTVKAVLGSGSSAVASSDGFTIDTSPPVFQTEVLLYIDVSQGNFTPVTFQGSNSTIKAVWKCSDNESEIVNYEWKIGSEPGGDDLQNYTSTGEYPGDTNSDLDGMLEHNTTYYVTVRCTNGGGLETTYIDTKGVTVLMEAPLAEDVDATIEGAAPLGEDIVPAHSMKTLDSHTVGASWVVSPDPTVKRYDFCVGSGSERECDIFPWTWVGYNESGTVKVEDGYLKLDNKILYKLNQIRRGYNGSTDVDTDRNAFTMAPATTMFIFMKVCNEAQLCTFKLLGSTLVENNNTQVVTAHGKAPLRIGVGGGGLRRRRALSDITVETPPGLEDGHSVVVTELTPDDLQAEYRSDASVDFVPYITNPDTTTSDNTFLDRHLQRRLKFNAGDTSFSVTSVGGLPLPGPLSVTFTFSSVPADHTVMLLHWNPETHHWEQSNKTCRGETNTETRTSSSVTVKICDTHSNGAGSDNFTGDSYFRHATQFLVTTALTLIPNDPPELSTPTSLSMEEDQGTLLYQMTATDPDGDDVKFRIAPEFEPSGLDIALSEDGFLMYTPAVNFYGSITIPVIIYEVGLTDIEPLEVPVDININVTMVNDAPVVMAFSNYTNILHADPSHPVIILLEQERANDTETIYRWTVAMYDVDDGDSLTLDNTDVINGTMTLTDTSNDIPCLTGSGIPCADITLPKPANSLNWVSQTFTFRPGKDFFGTQDVRIYARDESGAYSDVVTVRLVVMERRCENGVCKSKNEEMYTCDDPRRAESFDLYYTCECGSGWSGEYCMDDVNECFSNPCTWPYVCYDNVDGYQCSCPQDTPNCDGFQAWMIALIVLGVILIIILSFLAWYLVMMKRGRLSYKTLWSRITGKENATGKTSFFNGGFTDDMNRSLVNNGQQSSDCGQSGFSEGASWVIYSGNPIYSATAPMKSVGETTFKRVPHLADKQSTKTRATMEENAPRNKKWNGPKYYHNATTDRAMTPVEDDRPSSSESLFRHQFTRGETLKLKNEPAPDYDI